MNSKGIIGTIVVVGIVVIGAVYFMTAKPANASTNNANTSQNALNSNATTTSPQNSNLNNNGNTQGQNNSSQTNSNGNNNINSSSSNQANNDNNGGQTNSTSVNQVQDPTPAKVVTPTINNGTGNFADIMTGANYMTGSIDGTQIIIPLQGGHVINNLLVLPEYYVNRLGETFTAKIASLGNNNFKLYEYYGNKNTAIFDLKYHSQQYEPTLAGTFTHSGSNEVTGITFDIINNNIAPPLMSMPFYHTVINGTPVTVLGKDNSDGGYYEKYAGDSNLFNLKVNYNYYNGTKPKYQQELIESYNGKETGEYLLNETNNGQRNNGDCTGVFISHPGTSESQTFNVTLTGSLSPQ